MSGNYLKEFSERLGEDWIDLADYLKINQSKRSRFERGREPQEIIKWLNIRNKINELIPALDEIERQDLIEVASNIIKQELDKLKTKSSVKDGAKESQPQASVRINLRTWALQISKNDPLPDRLLYDITFNEEEGLFQSLNDFLKVAIETGLSVEVYDNRTQLPERLKKVEDLWIRVIIALVDDPEAKNLNSWKWLITETVKALRGRLLKPHTIISKVWGFIFKRYCEHKSAQHRLGLLTNITKAAFDIAKKERRHNFLYPFINFLYDNLKSDVLSIQEIVENLKEYERQIGNNETPNFLGQLKILIGIGTNTATHGIEDIPPLNLQRVHIPETELCNYEFEAMVYPLTVSEYSSLRGILPRDAGENPALPYVFKVVSDKGRDIFNSFTAEVQSIINLCRRFEPDENFEWDVPTICEWITLAGCDDQPYPWGTDDLTPDYANFDFGEGSKLFPVGTYPLGVSRYGTYDCFGNVHEIVRSSNGGKFPKDFRLAGGCYQTNSRLAIPRFIRGFKTRDEENRRNISLRLVRYNSSVNEMRFHALQRYKER